MIHVPSVMRPVVGLLVRRVLRPGLGFVKGWAGPSGSAFGVISFRLILRLWFHYI